MKHIWKLFKYRINSDAFKFVEIRDESARVMRIIETIQHQLELTSIRVNSLMFLTLTVVLFVAICILFIQLMTH